VRLGRKAPAAEKAAVGGPPDGSVMSAQQVYAFYFHGPAYQVVASAWRCGGQAVAALAEGLPDNHRPPEQPLLMAPRLVESCFQAAGLWQAGTEGLLALPQSIGRVRVLRDPAKAKGALQALAQQTAPGCFDCSVVDAAGHVVVRLEGYRSIPTPSPIPEAVMGDLRATFLP
jgi:hypothetical protein